MPVRTTPRTGREERRDIFDTWRRPRDRERGLIPRPPRTPSPRAPGPRSKQARDERSSPFDSDLKYGNRGGSSEAKRYLTDPYRDPPPYKEDNKPHFLTPDLAVVRIHDWLDSDVGKRTARKSLERVRDHVRNRNASPLDLPFDIWATLDNGLFGGRLSPGVYLNWTRTELDPTTPGRTYAKGCMYRPREVKRVAVQMNWEFFMRRAAGPGKLHPDGRQKTRGEQGDEAIVVLIHQMVHAWFMRACGRLKKAKEPDERLKHGPAFWQIMHEIADISKATDIYGDELEFAECMKRLHDPDDDAGPAGRQYGVAPGRTSSERLRREIESDAFEHSVCSLFVSEFTGKDDAEKWLKKVTPAAREATSETLYDLNLETLESKGINRTERGSPSSYIEVVWDAKPFNHKRKDIDKRFASLKEAFSDGKRVLFLPAGIDPPTFRIIDSFIKSGVDYLPSLPGSYRSGIPWQCAPFRGPEPAPGYLLADVRAYKLGVAMPFPELASCAEARLHRARPLYSSPLPALGEIYDSFAPSYSYPAPIKGTGALAAATYNAAAPLDALRRWARAFMMETQQGSRDGAYYSSNIFGVEKHCGGAGITGLIASTQSRELEQDYCIALSSLWERTPQSMRPPGGVFRGGSGEPLLGKIPIDVRALPGANGGAGLDLDIRNRVDIDNEVRNSVRIGNDVSNRLRIENDVRSTTRDTVEEIVRRERVEKEWDYWRRRDLERQRGPEIIRDRVILREWESEDEYEDVESITDHDGRHGPRHGSRGRTERRPHSPPRTTRDSSEGSIVISVRIGSPNDRQHPHNEPVTGKRIRRPAGSPGRRPYRSDGHGNRRRTRRAENPPFTYCGVGQDSHFDFPQAGHRRTRPTRTSDYIWPGRSRPYHYDYYSDDDSPEQNSARSYGQADSYHRNWNPGRMSPDLRWPGPMRLM